MDRNDVMAGAKKIAASLEGPFGRRKLQPVIAEHLDYFQKARASGALWPQIAEALARAGIRSPEGAPYRANILRALFSRAERADESPVSQQHLALKTRMSKLDVSLPPGREPKAQTSRPRPVSSESPSKPLPPSGHLEEIRNRIARASRLRGLGKDDK